MKKEVVSIYVDNKANVLTRVVSHFTEEEASTLIP